MPKAKGTTQFAIPESIAALLKPIKTTESDRKVWSIGLNTVWLPFFTATNTTHATSIPHDALGAPLRLAREKDGTPRFSQSGRPVVRVAKELSDEIKKVRENFVFNLMNHAAQVATAMPERTRRRWPWPRRIPRTWTPTSPPWRRQRLLSRPPSPPRARPRRRRRLPRPPTAQTPWNRRRSSPRGSLSPPKHPAHGPLPCLPGNGKGCP